MEGRVPGQAELDELLGAPEHVIDMLAAVMRPPSRPAGPEPGSVPFARLARAEAKVYADRIWAEAIRVGFQAGAERGPARNPHLAGMVVTAERLAERAEDTG